jgi:hypothetical protein
LTCVSAGSALSAAACEQACNQRGKRITFEAQGNPLLLWPDDACCGMGP